MRFPFKKCLVTTLLIFTLLTSVVLPSFAVNSYPLTFTRYSSSSAVSYPWVYVKNSSGTTLDSDYFDYDSTNHIYSAELDHVEGSNLTLSIGDAYHGIDFPYAGDKLNYTFVVSVYSYLNLTNRKLFNFLPDDCYLSFVDPATNSTSNLALQYVNNFSSFDFVSGGAKGFYAVFDIPASLANSCVSFINFEKSGACYWAGDPNVRGWIIPSSSGAGGCNALELAPYLEELISNTESIEQTTIDIYELLLSFGQSDFAGSSSQITDGSAKLDTLLTSEGQLLPQIDESVLSVNVDPVSHNLVWSLVTNALNIRPEILSLYITCLTLGIVILIFNRR